MVCVRSLYPGRNGRFDNNGDYAARCVATAFSGATEITLASAAGSEEAPGGWTITGGLFSQVVPARTPTGTYTLGLTITYT